MKINLNVKTELTIWLVAVMALTLGALGLFSYAYLSLNNDIMLSNIVMSRASDVIEQFQAGKSADQLEVLREAEVVLILNPDLVQRRTYPEGYRGGEFRDTTLGELAEQYDRTLDGQSPDARMSVYFINSNDGDSPVLAVGISNEAMSAFVDDYREILLAALPVALVVFTAGAFFLIWTALAPISRMTRVAREIQEKDLSRRIEVKKRDEVGQLAITFNAMLDRLENAFNRERRFMADAAHELRTPLAVIQSEATGGLQRQKETAEYRESLALISRETEYMADIMRNLLLLVRTESGAAKTDRSVDVDLKELLTEIGEDVAVLCQDRGLEYSLDAPDKVLVSGDTLLLKRLFMNIFENAVRYNRDGGSVTASLGVNDDQVIIRITDTGIGIPPEELPLVFDRFYRGRGTQDDGPVEGTGLGLAIALTAAEIHGGSIEVQSRPAEGSEFTIRLPLANEERK